MKKKLLFDGRTLKFGLKENACRSGIYFTAFNILKNIYTSDVFDISVYCEPKDVIDLKIFLENELNRTVNFCYTNTSLLKKISAVADDRQKARQRKQKLRRLFFTGLYSFLKIFLHREKNFDISFSPQFTLPNKLKGKKHFAILYDAIPFLRPGYDSDYKTEWYSKLIATLNKKDRYFAISQATKTDLLRFVNRLYTDQLTVTPLAAAENFKPYLSCDLIKSIKEKYHIPADKKYVFSLCTLEPRKNLIRTVKTFVEFVKKNKVNDMVYVLGGGHWDTFLPKLKEQLKELPAELVCRIGYVADADLPVLYSGAHWFVYTSQYEGFGLPPLEAMACGCPVITSNNSSLPEVVGNAGVMIDWNSDEQHVKAYENYYFNEKLRSEMAAKGLLRAQQFSWEKTANLMIEEFLK